MEHLKKKQKQVPQVSLLINSGFTKQVKQEPKASNMSANNDSISNTLPQLPLLKLSHCRTGKQDEDDQN